MRMKVNDFMDYEVPFVEVVEVEVDQGFTVSGLDAPDYERGDDWNW